MPRCTIGVKGLDCPTEAQAIRSALADMQDVEELTFDFEQGRVEVAFGGPETRPRELADAIRRKTGMAATVLPEGCAACAAPGVSGQETGVGPGSWWHDRWGLVLISGFALSVGHALVWTGKPWQAARIAFAVPLFVAGWQLFPKAWRSLLHRRLDIHVLMTIAMLGAMALGQWDEGATVAFLFGLSEALEAMSLERARRAVRSLLELTPDTADLVDLEGRTVSVPAAEVLPGQHVLIRAGARVPVDGRVVRGRTRVDQRSITGESVPVFKGVGDEVFAGTVNGEGAIEVEATRPLGEAVVTRIAEQVRAAQRGRTPIERTVERFAGVYTPIVVVLAVLVMLVPPLVLSGASPTWWFRQGLVVLIIACPCALVIATPVAIVSALAAAARRGILIKGGQFLEAFGKLRVIAFDKTGTLTRGEPDVVEVVAARGHNSEQLVRIAAALGERGGHVVGRAIARHARELALDVPRAEDYQATPGLGASARVDATEYHIGSHRYLDEAGLCGPEYHESLAQAEAEIGTSVAVSSRCSVLGWLRLADRPRPEAPAVLQALRRQGIDVVMLTGDNAATARAISRELGMSAERSELLPGDKARIVQQLDANHGPTGMVGDGVNDAPALAAARVSVALGGISSGAALETADVVLMADDLSGLPWLVEHSRRTRAIIRANIAMAVGAKLVFLVLAILGLATLWMAIVADLGVSLLVVANALRLLRPRREPELPGTAAPGNHPA